MVFLFFDISGGEIFIIMIIILIVFGPGKIPEIARKIGKGMAEVRKASNTIKHEIMSESENIRKEVTTEGTEIKKKLEEASSKISEQTRITDKNNN